MYSDVMQTPVVTLNPTRQPQRLKERNGEHGETRFCYRFLLAAKYHVSVRGVWRYSLGLYCHKS